MQVHGENGGNAKIAYIKLGRIELISGAVFLFVLLREIFEDNRMYNENI